MYVLGNTVGSAPLSYHIRSSKCDHSTFQVFVIFYLKWGAQKKGWDPQNSFVGGNRTR